MATASPTSAFIDALRYGDELVTARFTVFEKGVATGTAYYGQVSTGTFTVDRNSEWRRSGELTVEVVPTVPPPVLVPTNPDSLLAPFGNEVFIECGITGSGNLENIQWVPLGLYAIATSTVDDTTIDMTVTLELYDRSWTIAQRTFKQPYNFPAAGGNFITEIQTLLNSVWNQQQGVQPLSYNIVPTSQTVPTASYDQGSDPWQAALDMATSIGYELFVDEYGVVVGKPIPNPYTTAPVWNFSDQESDILGYSGTGSAALLGSPYSTPIEISVQMTRDGISNDIIVQGEGDAVAATYNGDGVETSGPAVLGEAADTNPQSPTYIGGGMGDVPDFEQSSLVATTPAAQLMAQNDLQVALSSAWTATISHAPIPHLDVDDVVTITRPRVGFWRTKMVIDTIVHVISYADECQITGRILSP